MLLPPNVNGRLPGRQKKNSQELIDSLDISGDNKGKKRTFIQTN